MGSVVQFPQQVPFVDSRNRIDYRWVRSLEAFLQKIEAGPAESGAVADGSAASYAPMTLYQGPDSNKSGTPNTGDIYYALDTGKIYWAQSGNWVLLSEELTGDVTKPANSNVTALKDVFVSPGTYGGPTKTPILSIDSKGRVTSIALEDIPGSAITTGGALNSLQFNAGSTLGGASILFNAATGGLVFANPAPTREALSPLTTKGDIFVRSDTQSTRLPIGADNQVLIADSTAPNGMKWATTRTVDIPFQFNVINPFPLLTVPADVLVKTVTTYIEVVFDGSGAVISVGDAVDNSRLQDNADPYEEAGYQSTPSHRYSSDTAISLFINPGSASQGSGLVSIELQER